MPTRTALLSALALVVYQSASALDIRGVAPGDPWNTTKIQRAFPELQCGEAECKVGWLRLGTTKVLMQITSDNSLVQTIHFDIGELDGFERLMQDFSKKFGKPSGKRITPTQNAYGAHFVDEQYWWFTRKDEVVCHFWWEGFWIGSCELRPRSKEKPEAPGPI